MRTRLALTASQHAQCYTRQFDRFLRGTATLSSEQDGVMKDQFFGDSVVASDAAAGRIVYRRAGAAP